MKNNLNGFRLSMVRNGRYLIIPGNFGFAVSVTKH